MLRTIVSGAAVAGSLAFSTSAAADTPAREFSNAPFILSIDRAIPIISYANVSLSNPSNSSQGDNVSATALGLMTAGNPLTINEVPRLSIDTVVASNVSLGLSAWVWTVVSESLQVKGQSTSVDEPKQTYWGLAPRVGYILPVADVVALWPRLGVEYHKLNTSTVSTGPGGFGAAGGSQEYQLSADIEAALVVTPVHHFGITLTVYGAIPIVGGIQGNITTSGLGASGGGANLNLDSGQLSVGLTLGLLGYF